MLRIRALLAVLAVATLAACTQSPTATQQPDTGMEFGSPTIGTGL